MQNSTQPAAADAPVAGNPEVDSARAVSRGVNIDIEVDRPPTFVIEPARWTWSGLWRRVREVFEHRELYYMFAWRDLTVRYKQSLIGVAWAVLQPLLMVAVFSLLLGRLGGFGGEGVSYALSTLAGLLPWQLFSQSVHAAAVSLVQHESMLRKVYFPRVLVPLAPLSVGLADFAVGCVVLLIWTLAAIGGLSWSALWLLPSLGLALLTTVGAACWLSALNVRFRDVQVAMPLLMQVWFFATPVFYSSSLVPNAWRPLYALNPLVAVVDGFRRALFGQPALEPLPVLISLVAALTLAISGLLFFWYTEDSMADLL